MKLKPSHRPAWLNPTTFLSFLVVGSFFILDQFLKYIANAHPNISFPIIPGFLNWELLHNPGVAFGLPIPNWILLIITPIILVLFIFLFFNRKQGINISVPAIMLIIAGAVSNFIDRFLFGITIDYLRIWNSVMNIADIMIVVGAIIIFIDQRKKP